VAVVVRLVGLGRLQEQGLAQVVGLVAVEG
jgi:hypothetical protein